MFIKLLWSHDSYCIINRLAIKKLKSQRHVCDELISCPGKVLFRQTLEKASAVGESMGEFYQSLPDRSKMVEENSLGVYCC